MKTVRGHRRRLSGEPLEPRLVLDGGVPLLAGVGPDSQLGDDPHVDTISADASHLDFVDGIHARVDSYIDSPDDIDVFQFAATRERLRIGGLLVEGRSDVHLVNQAGDIVIGIEETAPDDGFIQCEWGDFGFCDVFPTSPGETYFVTIGGHRVETSEYYFEFSQEDGFGPPAVPADSQPGEDPHPDRVGDDATVLEVVDGDSPAAIDSFIDESGDIDVFQFQAPGRQVNVRATSRADNMQLLLHVLNSAGNVVESNTGDVGVDNAVITPSVDVLTNPGETYFIRLRARVGEVGRYRLELTNVGADVATPQPPIANPDSNLGDDPHPAEMGADATPLDFVDVASHESFVTVDSYIDQAGDVDVFRFTARHASAVLSAYSWFDVTGFSVELYDSRRSLLALAEVRSAAANGASSFANLELSLNRGETYYVAVSGTDATMGEYVLNVLQKQPDDSMFLGDKVDSTFGNDTHVNHVGPDATTLELDHDGHGTAHSYLDTADDVDVFQFTGTGGVAFAAALNMNRHQALSVRVLDADQNEVEATVGQGGLVNAPYFILWSTAANQTYFVEVTAGGAFDARYVLEILADRNAEDGSNVADRFNLALARLPDAPGSDDRVGATGDANFDGRVDATDFAIWHERRFQHVRGPRNGDFNGDGVADIADFNIWNDHRFAQPAAAATAAPRTPRAPAGAGSSLSAEAAYQISAVAPRSARYSDSMMPLRIGGRLAAGSSEAGLSVQAIDSALPRVVDELDDRDETARRAMGGDSALPAAGVDSDCAERSLPVWRSELVDQLFSIRVNHF